MEILKRSGKKQKFSLAKLRRGITRAARDAKLRRMEANKIVNEVARSVFRGLKGRRSVRAAELRTRILTRLDRTAKRVASAWRRFDRKRR